MGSLCEDETGILFAVCEKVVCQLWLHLIKLQKNTVMAKANSLITLLGTYDGMTFVKSSAYGNHVRAARGTRKKAVLNEACQAQSEKLVRSNLPAQIIRNAINPYRQDFYYGLLWQKLVGLTNDALESDKPFDFSRLKPFEAHKKYRLTRLAEVTTSTKSDMQLSKL